MTPAKSGIAPAREVPYHVRSKWGGARMESAEAKKLPFHVRNLEILEEFIRTLPSLSKRRIDKYRSRMGKISRDLGKPFDQVTKDDLRLYIQRINGSPDFTDWTKLDYRIFIKKFFAWMHDREWVSWIRLGKVKAAVGVDDILTDLELDNLRRACDNSRDRALIETAYEGAFRPHELLSLTKSMVAFDEYGAKISLQTGKTGPRSVRVVNAAPLLAEWISQHPLKKSNDAPLWIDLSNDTQYRALRWLGLAKIVKRIAKRAGIEKRMNVYVFRHTRLTNLSKELTEPQLCMIAGWELGSDMPRNYVHLSGRDVDEALLKTYGLVKSKETKEIRTPKKCSRCGTVCSFESQTCSKCGMALSLTAALEKDQELDELKEKQRRQQETIDLILNTPGLAELFRNHTSSS